MMSSRHSSRSSSSVRFASSARARLVALAFACAAIAAGPPLPDQLADIDETVRFVPTTQPEQPAAQRPPISTPANVDTGRPPHEWQRATDDWAGLRPRLEDRGVALNASLTLDSFRNLRGGLDTAHGDVARLVNVNLTLDTDRLFGLAGGTFFANFQHAGGDDASASVGDFQGVSSIASDRRDQISEIWYEQVLTGDATPAVRIKLGKIDANTEFDATEFGGEFLNGSSGVSPTLVGLPTYPDPAFGGVVSVDGERLYARLGLFDGSGQEGHTTGNDGPRSLFGSPADLFWIGEVGVRWTGDAGHDGSLALGATWHTGTFDAFDGGTDRGAASLYVVVDQRLFKEEPENDEDQQGAGLFVRLGLADGDVSAARAHAGAGVAWTGAIAGRDDDVAGVAVNWVTFGRDPALDGGDEVNVELFYKVQFTRFLSLKPDVQYVHNPGGDASVRDAIAIGARLDLQF